MAVATAWTKNTHDVPNTHVQQAAEKQRTIKKTEKQLFQEKLKQGIDGEEEAQSGDTQSEDDDGGHLLDLVYDAVRNGQSPYELERDGWYAGEIHEAVGTWYELSHGLGSGI